MGREADRFGIQSFLMNGPPHRPARHLPRGTPSQPVLPRVPTQAVHRPLDWELGYCRAGKYGDLLIWISLLATLSIRIRVWEDGQNVQWQ